MFDFTVKQINGTKALELFQHEKINFEMKNIVPLDVIFISRGKSIQKK